MEIEEVTVKTEPEDVQMQNFEVEEVEDVPIKKEPEEELHNNDRPFKCGICGLRSTTDALLRVHMKVHLVKRLHECSICHDRFNVVTELNRHVLLHTEGRSNYICVDCEVDCFTQEALNKHSRSHKLEKPFKCKLCERTFAEDGYLRIHERSHHGEEYQKKSMLRDGTFVDPSAITIKEEDNYKDYKCSTCERNFLDEEFLKNHMRMHTTDFGSLIFGDTLIVSSDIDVEQCRTIIAVEEKEETSLECGFLYKSGQKCSRRFGEKMALEVHFQSHNMENNMDSLGENMTRCKEIVKGKEKTVFKCTLCGKFFPVPSKLRTHMRTHTGEKPYKCDVCSKAFGTAGSLKDHGLLHSTEKPFKCTICDKGFTKSSSLEDHIRSHTGEKPYECNICKKKYTTRVILNQHLLAHSKEKPFKCDVCNKSFIYLCNLKHHMVTHTGAKPFACTSCDKSYALKSALRMHIMEHSGDKPHKCSFCGKTFTTLGSLKKHERVHTGEKPYRCKLCDKGFTQTSSLSRHLDVHTGEKPYKCTVCTKGFTSASYLKIHLHLHRGEDPYTCKLCDKPFRVLKLYRTHLKTHKNYRSRLRQIVNQRWTQKVDDPLKVTIKNEVNNTDEQT